MDLDRLRYGRLRFERNDEGERAAARAKGYLAMRAATRKRMISIMALVLVTSICFRVTPYSKGGKTIPENGQIAHRGCNARKNAQLPAT